MGKLKGFLEFDRIDEYQVTPSERIKNYSEFTISPSPEELNKQGGRCMDCGVPFCHSGCPLGNLIPDFNDAVYKNDWKKALNILHSTNNFPEFTGRLCPAPCEQACVLGLVSPPVSIEMIEKYIVEKGFKEGWIKPIKPTHNTGKKVAVIGSGPAGLAAAQQLNRAGHRVTVFEKDNKIGGLLRYGIPDFKMEKNIIDRRLEILIAEGIEFNTSIEIGKDIPTKELEKEFDAIIMCIGASVKRNLPIPGSDLKGVIQAMDFLPNSNKFVDKQLSLKKELSAKNKDVIVIGGGDTGSDCIGTSNRQGAKSVTNFEITSKPSEERTNKNPWPFWPFKLKTSSSHEEGSQREWSIMTKEFIGDGKGNLSGLKTVEIKWNHKNEIEEIKGTEKIWPCQMVLLALGFLGPEKSIAEKFELKLNQRGNIQTDEHYKSSKNKIFAAGDARRGQSLIVWAISEGRDVAFEVDKFLMGKSFLTKKNSKGDLISA